MVSKNITIGSRKIGDNCPVFIIAEVSANHRGSIKTALSAIDSAKKAGADAVKFQHLTHDKIAAEPLSTFYKSAELPYEWTPRLIKRAREKEIIFLSTPFDTEAIEVLNDHGVPAFKVASYEMTDDILLKFLARGKKPIILSTGMAYLEEVKHAVKVIKGEGNNQIILLHCVSLYPPKPIDINLKVLKNLRNELDCLVGYSDHMGPESNLATLGAVAHGAVIIERHITDSQEGGSNDDRNSLTTEQFKKMVKDIRTLEEMITGSGIKAPVSDRNRKVDEISERKTRRSLYANRNIKAGEVIDESMIITLRPMRGVEPKDLKQIIGRKLARDVSYHHPIKWKDLVND